MPKVEQPETIEITNFSGALTRKKNGKIDSGLAKFSTSFGYDPFSKPGQLTWLEQPSSIAGLVGANLVVAAKPQYDPVNSAMFVYALTSNSKYYKIQSNTVSNPNVDSVVGITSVLNNGQSFNYGGAIEFYNNQTFISGDKGVSISSVFGVDTFVGNANDYTPNTYHPLVQFVGKLIFGNGNNIGVIDTTNGVVSSVISSHYEQLSPGLPSQSLVTDIDPSIEGNYIQMTTSGIGSENLTDVVGDRQVASGSNGTIFLWNGTDSGVTSYKSIPSYAVTALQTYLDSNMFFSNDSFGASISNGSQKIVSLPNNKSPFPNATTSNGNFLTWICTELNGSTISASLYYYGRLDNDNPIGLWRVLRYSTSLSAGYIHQSPVNVMINNKYSTTNNAVNAIITLGYGKHYFSTYEINSGHSGTDVCTLQKFLITPTGTGTPQLGVYETQNQLFSKRISLSEIRVYTEPTATGNGFQLDLIGSDGNVISNGTFTYSYAAGTDITLLQGALERINFNPNNINIYSLGIRITNTGTTNMVINKIEVDWSPSGK